MRGQHHRLAALLTLFGLSALLSFANSAKNHFMTAASSAPPSVSTGQGDDMRLEGEKRFHANCGRCHMAPHKYSPRVMATAVRHMRVRANITDADMRLILYCLTQ